MWQILTQQTYADYFNNFIRPVYRFPLEDKINLHY